MRTEEEEKLNRISIKPDGCVVLTSCDSIDQEGCEVEELGAEPQGRGGGSGPGKALNEAENVTI
jgi:hypothetical protein